MRRIHRKFGIFLTAFSFTMMFCLVLLGLLMVGRNAASSIISVGAVADASLDFPKARGEMTLFGTEYTLDLGFIEDSLRFLRRHYYLVPAPVRLGCGLGLVAAVQSGWPSVP